MAENTAAPVKEKSPRATAALLVLPLVVLAFVILLFLRTGGGLNLTPPAPVEALTVERTILRPGEIELIVRNTDRAGPDAFPGDCQQRRLALHDLA